MSGEYFGRTWINGKKPRTLEMLWNVVFGRRKYPWDSPRPHHFGVAADVLRNLAECPQACKLLADALELEIDPGESAASWVSEVAMHESLKAVAKRDQLYADESARKAR